MDKVPEDRKATEYLSNERTFLAWVRTSISVIALGFVVAKFGVWLRELSLRLAPGITTPSTGLSLLIGISMMAFGGALVLLAAWHYHIVNESIMRGEVKPNRGLVLIVTGSVTLLAVAMIVYMILL